MVKKGLRMRLCSGSECLCFLERCISFPFFVNGPTIHYAADPVKLLFFSDSGKTSSVPDDSLVNPLDTNFQGGGATFSDEQLNEELNNERTHNVYQDVLTFTGLNDTELRTRLRRDRQHHFYIEHKYYSPESSRELALYYRHSVGYLWGNAVHNSLDLGIIPITAAN